MEKLIIEIMDQIAAEGGIVTAVGEGKVQADVNRAAFEREKSLQSGETKKVGVNCFMEDEEKEQPVAFHPYREEEAAQQIERLERIRRERDHDSLHAALEKLRADARTGQNIMPAVMDAVECYATVGEVCGVLKEVFGTYIEPIRF